MPAFFIYLIRLVRGIRDGLKEPEFRGLFWSVLLILLSGTWFYHAVEGWGWLDSFYFSVITLTTVRVMVIFHPKRPLAKSSPSFISSLA